MCKLPLAPRPVHIMYPPPPLYKLRPPAPYLRRSCAASLDRWDNMCRGSAA